MTPPARAVIAAVLALAPLAAGGCGGKSSASTASTSATPAGFDFGDNDPRKVTAFGDSITFGVLELRVRRLGLTTSNTYPALLQARLQALDPAWRVVNRGRGGEDTFHGVSRIGSVLAGDRPGFVLIMEGTNDASECESAPAIMGNLASMVNQAKARKTIPVLATVPPNFRNDPCAQDVVNQVNVLIRGFTQSENVVLAEVFDGMNDRSLFGQAPDRDPLHPNDRGYAVMADIFYGALLKAVPGGVVAAAQRRRH